MKDKLLCKKPLEVSNAGGLAGSVRAALSKTYRSGPVCAIKAVAVVQK
jgi:hypothetical protein